jgi:hypothetical protein
MGAFLMTLRVAFKVRRFSNARQTRSSIGSITVPQRPFLTGP